jgi:hypothetical protein
LLLVGFAVAIALGVFGAQSAQSNKDAIVNDLNNMATHAYHYRARLKVMAGGEGSYVGYTIPVTMASNENASYSCTTSADDVTFTAVSAQNPANTIVCKIGTGGKFIANAWIFTGDFQ